MAAFNNLLDQTSILDIMDLTPTEKLVAIVLLSFRNAETGRCNPPIFSENPKKKTLCTRTGLSRRSVIVMIKKLEEKHVIKTEKEIGKTTGYQFTLTRAVDAPVQEVHPCTTCTTPVQEVHPTRAPRAPITNKEQIKNRQDINRDDSFTVNDVNRKPRLPSGKDEANQSEISVPFEDDLFSLTSTEEVNVPDGYDDLPETDEKKGKAAKLTCPYDEIVDLYHEKLPELNGVNKVLLSDSRKQKVKARWDFLVKDGEATTRKDGLALISRYFGCVRKQPFLLGANNRGWRADFDWLFKQENFIKVLEFKYGSEKTHRV